MLHHSKYLVGDGSPFLGGSFAVEFYFLVSGTLMMQSIAKQQPSNSLSEETVAFLWKKYKSFCPDMFIAWFIGLIFVIICKELSLHESMKLFSNGFWEMTLLHMSGIFPTSVNTSVWYLSSMLLCMAILYPLIRKYGEFTRKMLLPLLSITILGFLYHTYGNLRGPTANWSVFTFKGNLRAFAELSLGVVCYEAVTRIKRIRWSNAGRMILTIVKWGTYLLSIFYMSKDYYSFDFQFLLILMIAVTLSFSNIGVDTKVFQNNVIKWLGKFSVSLYLVHFPFARNLGRILPDTMTLSAKIGIYFCTSFLVALFVMYFSRFVKKRIEQQNPLALLLDN